MPGVLRGVLERLTYPIALDLAALAGRLYRQQLADLSAWFAERISSQVWTERQLASFDLTGAYVASTRPSS